jgi:hypothetical protein
MQRTRAGCQSCCDPAYSAYSRQVCPDNHHEADGRAFAATIEPYNPQENEGGLSAKKKVMKMTKPRQQANKRKGYRDCYSNQQKEPRSNKRIKFRFLSQYNQRIKL